MNEESFLKINCFKLLYETWKESSENLRENVCAKQYHYDTASAQDFIILFNSLLRNYQKSKRPTSPFFRIIFCIW